MDVVPIPPQQGDPVKFAELMQAHGYSDADIVAELKKLREQQAPPAEPRGDIITPQELYALHSSPESLKASLEPAPEIPPEPSLLDRMKAGASNIVQHPGEAAAGAAGTVGSLLTRAADTASLGGYSKARNLLYGMASPRLAEAAQQQDESFGREHPFVSGMADAAGYLTPGGIPDMAAQAAGKVVGAAGKVIAPAAERFLSPMAGRIAGKVATGAGEGALANAAIAGGEAGVAGGSPDQMVDAAAEGAKGGFKFGGVLGALAAGRGELAHGADARITERNIADATEGASAMKRDRVVGKGGSKAADVDSLIRRTPDFQAAAGDPLKQAPVVQRELDRLDQQAGQVYGGVAVPVKVLTTPMRELAARLRKEPGIENNARAAHLDAQAADYESKLTQQAPSGTQVSRPQVIDAARARELATAMGKGLFDGNPNNLNPGVSRTLGRELYGRVVGQLNNAVEVAKPGIRPELDAMNQEYSNWLNIKDAVSARAARAQTPSMTGKNIVDRGVDMILGVTHPVGYVAKHALQHFGPGAARSIDNGLSSPGAPGPNPLVQAMAQQQKRQQEANVIGAIFGPERGKPGPNDKQDPQQQGP